MLMKISALWDIDAYVLILNETTLVEYEDLLQNITSTFKSFLPHEKIASYSPTIKTTSKAYGTQ
jgi:hypothetical protein